MTTEKYQEGDYVIVNHHEFGQLIGKIIKHYGTGGYCYKIQTKKGAWLFAESKYLVMDLRPELRDYIICDIKDIFDSTPEKEADLKFQIACIENILN